MGYLREHWRAVACAVVSISMVVTAAVMLGATDVLRTCRAQEAAEAPTREEVVRGVRAREIAAHTIQYSSGHRMLVPKYSRPTQDEMGAFDMQGGPPKDTEKQKSVSIVIDGSRMYAAVGGPTWTAADGGHFFDTQDSLWMLEGGTCVSYFGAHEAAVVDANFLRHTVPDVIPVVIAYRMLDPVVGLAQPYELFPVERVTYDGHPCVVMEYRRSMYDTTDSSRYWLAEDMDYSVLRYESSARTIHFRYEPAGGGLWRLTSWSAGQPNPVSQTYLSVKEVAVRLNQPVDASLFDWQSQLPAGTNVSDLLKHEE
ncbi:MAG: hypothetical protein R6V05_03025 [Candidatus Brocadiia bacterium]